MIGESPQAAFLEEMQKNAKLWIRLGAAATIASIAILAINPGNIGVIVGGIGVFCGLFFVWFGAAWLRLLPKARRALAMPPIEVRLQTWRGTGFWRRFTNAQLWPPDPDAPHSLAQFSETMHWAKPRYMLVDKTPTTLHGYPIAGAIVVASCPDGVVIGRIKRSHFDENH